MVKITHGVDLFKERLAHVKETNKRLFPCAYQQIKNFIYKVKKMSLTKKMIAIPVVVLLEFAFILL